MRSISELVNMSSKDNVVCFGVEQEFVKAYYLPHQFVSPQNELQSILRFTVGQLKWLCAWSIHEYPKLLRCRPFNLQIHCWGS